MAQDSKATTAFAERLVAAMMAKGHTSNRSRTGVDVSALSRSVGVSYEMARRYVEGLALPRPDTVDAIAQWLGIPSSALAWGETVQNGAVDPLLLERVLLAVADAQRVAGVELETNDAARIVAQLYQEARTGEAISSATLAVMFKVMARK